MSGREEKDKRAAEALGRYFAAYLGTEYSEPSEESKKIGEQVVAEGLRRKAERES